MELNEEFRKALSLMEDSSRHILITGRAGTGKSTLLEYFRNHTRKSVVVLAPTGVAALNVKGQTIHSFFRFKPDITPSTVKGVRPSNKEIYKRIDTIVIDEISMVRADLLDCINEFLKIHGRRRGTPFGGIQMVFIGDLYQLPPVVTSREKALFNEYYESPYFFSSKAFQEIATVTSPPMEFIELEKVYRQKDEEFLRILNAIRNNTVTDDDLRILNSRCIPQTATSPSFDTGDKFYISLTPTNTLAEEINRERLERLKGKEYHYTGYYEGEFTEKDLPAPLNLSLKIGAQVMLLNNDPEGRWINGSIGSVVDISKDREGDDVIWVKLEDGEVVDVTPHRWEMYEFSYDKDSKSIVSHTVGIYVQYPLRLAWAITIHKSQGLTFDRVIIDIGKGTFSHGQLYVALSRCRSLEGLVLKRPIERKHILMDRRVVRFITDYQYRLSERNQPLLEKIQRLEKAIQEGRPVEIVYLKSKDEKSKRVVIPFEVRDMDFNGKVFKGLRAFCTMRNDERIFNVERILEIR